MQPGKIWLIFELYTGHIGKSIWKYKADVPDFISVYENGGQFDYCRIPQATTGYRRLPWYWRFQWNLPYYYMEKALYNK